MILLLCVLLLCGCQRQTATDVVDFDAAQSAEGASIAPAQTADPAVSSDRAAVRILDTVAYALDAATPGETAAGAAQAILYGAVVFENSGSTPLRLTNAAFSFRADAGEWSQSFCPTLAEYDVLLPGERGYAAGWFEGSGFAAGTPVTLTAALDCAACAPARIALVAEDIFLADNYPGFTTVTGSLANPGPEDCALNMIYLAFYDAEDTLLGVWYFPRNAQLESTESIRFTSHMRALPIDGLAARTARTDCHAFGFH